jgi:hypothetical protein
MTTTNREQQNGENTNVPKSTLEMFIQAVEKKTNDPVHHRLLNACRQTNQPGSLEAELQTIVSEIISEA